MAEPTVLFKPGDTIEGYEVLKEIGQGAASVIYLVQEPKSKQVWALKHVHRKTEKDDRFLEQTTAEYEVASQLNHPGLRKVVKLFKKKAKLFTLTDVYLVMELVDGQSMDLRPPKTFDEAMILFIQTAHALKHMHERGFVHADMKPNNILVCPGPVAKVIDLGQSCKDGTVKPRIQGTPDYIAPEQVHRRPITPKTDIYNFGATMYWTLTRKAVPTALGKEDSLVGRLDDNLIPKAPHVRELNPKIPARLADLIMQCIEIDAANRPANMAYVVDRLELALAQVRAAKNDRSGGNPTVNGGSKSGTKSGQSAIMDSSSVVGSRVPERIGSADEDD